MNYKQNNWFSMILLAAMLAALLSAGCTAEQQKSNKIRAVADQIAGYTIPQGYTEQFAIDALGYQIVSLTGKTPTCHIYLLQAPKDTEVDVEKLQEQARSMEGEQKQNRSRDVHTVETRTATIRGQEVPVAVGEGINSENKPYREVSAVFDGRGGPTLVSISSPIDQWDWDQVNAFLASIE